MSFKTTVRRIKLSLRGCRLRPSLSLCSFEEGYCLGLFGFLIAIPFLDRWHKEPKDCMDQWGVYYDSNAVVWCWGNYTKFFHMPWDWNHCKDKHMVQVADGSWVKYSPSWSAEGEDARHISTFPYKYVLKNGEEQNVLARVYVERREWRRKCFWYIPWFAKKRTSIDVAFTAEVGERAGSWKGGCIGCGYDMLPGETVEGALRRMERDRKFN